MVEWLATRSTITLVNVDRLTLLDTNVLVYALDAEAGNHAIARTILDASNNAGAGLCVVPQILAEFFAVVTSSRRVRNPLTPVQAADVITNVLMLPGLSMLPTPADLVVRWLELLGRYPRTGQRIFDLQLVATMLGNGVTRICTFNDADFAGITGVDVVRPVAAFAS